MRLSILAILLISIPAWGEGECSISIDSIKPEVAKILEKVTEEPDESAVKEDFVEAKDELSDLSQRIEFCRNYYREHEFKNYEYERWGEKSKSYWNLGHSLGYLISQVEAVIESFELGSYRNDLFKISVWRWQLERFYATEI